MGLPKRRLGHGIALRPSHYDGVAADALDVEWLELISEGFLGVRGGARFDMLEAVCRERPVGLHGTRLSIGSVDPLDPLYLKELRELADRIGAVWVSDHLAWSSFAGRQLDLLPLPYTEEALTHVIGRVLAVQDTLKRQILLENPSSYVAFAESTMSEWEFLAAVSEQADCGILLDVNNLYVSAQNNGFDAGLYVRGLPLDRVAEIHLAGHRAQGDVLLDTHEGPVPDVVWDLYRQAVARLGAVPTIVEWDTGSPAIGELIAESARAARIEREIHEACGDPGRVLCADVC